MSERRSRTTLPLDFAASLPTGWEAVDGWHEVSIDGDAPPEYLLLFRFDVGQVGAVIFDGQLNGSALQGLVGMDDIPVGGTTGSEDVDSTPLSETATLTPATEPTTALSTALPTVTPAVTPSDAAAASGVPSQGFGYYRPYRLLPSYWAYSYGGDPGHGIVAPPDAADAIDVIMVPPPGSELTPETSAELLLRGGTTHLTFVWWKGPVTGYGVTQLVAYGGFTGIDWEEWLDAPEPIQAISGLEPLSDYRARSQICRQTDYTRQMPDAAAGTITDGQADVAPTVPETPMTDVAFAADDRGLRFCSATIPPYPFYPEGVVLAYLQRPPQGDRTLERLVIPGITTGQIDADGALDRLARERVDDIATYRTVPVPTAGTQTGEFAPTTSVCVQLTERASPEIQRWLVFTLRYQPPDSTAGLPDRWSIAGVRFEPQPVTPPQRPYCETVLARSAPQ